MADTILVEREGPFAILDGEHVLPEFFPMAAGFPQGAGQHLRGPDFPEARAHHAAADIVLDQAVEREAAGVPEHHPRPFFLLVEQVEPIADGGAVRAP